MLKPIKFAFFGGEPLAVPILNKLKNAGLIPSLIVCNPDRQSGRGYILTAPPVKIWAENEGIEVFQPTTYKDDTAREKLINTEWDLFVVVAYNFILPEWLLQIPRHKVINVHPSMLPKLRGASPIRTAILENLPEEVGVSIMLMDKEMDHGPILKQEKMMIDTKKDWPISGPHLDRILADRGGELLAEVIPAWLNNEIVPQEQIHDDATYCSRFQTGTNELAINPLQLPNENAALKAWCAINAFTGIGDTFFIFNEKRIKIKQATLENESLKILRVIPEGKKEIDFKDYLNQISK